MFKILINSRLRLKRWKLPGNWNVSRMENRKLVNITKHIYLPPYLIYLFPYFSGEDTAGAVSVFLYPANANAINRQFSFAIG